MRKSPLQKFSENYCRSNLFQIILLKIKQTKETINIPNTQNCILNVQACSFKVFTFHKKTVVGRGTGSKTAVPSSLKSTPNTQLGSSLLTE